MSNQPGSKHPERTGARTTAVRLVGGLLASAAVLGGCSSNPIDATTHHRAGPAGGLASGDRNTRRPGSTARSQTPGSRVRQRHEVIGGPDPGSDARRPASLALFRPDGSPRIVPLPAAVTAITGDRHGTVYLSTGAV